MPLIDLGSPRPAPVDLLDGLPRRVGLTLPELRYVARHAGDAPLPFDLAPSPAPATDPAPESDIATATAPYTAPAPAPERLTDRLGRTHDATEAAAYLAALDGLHDAATSLGRRGLLVDAGAAGEGHPKGVLDAGLVGAVGLLATPTVALDVDVAVGAVHARSWQRQRGGAVATLSTVDGVVFELAWFPTAAWSDELTRVALLPEDVVLRPSAVPDHLSLPFELADATGEAMRTSRSDVVPVLVAQHSGRTTDAAGRPLDDAAAVTVLGALGTESQGRLRVLVADVTAARTSVVGVVSWTLLADGWRVLRPHRVGEELHVEVRRVGPADLAGELAPVLAAVRSETHSEATP